MFISTVLLAASAATAYAAHYKSEYLYARALVEGNGIEARIDITAYTDGRPTTISVEGIKGLYDTEHGGVGPYLYHIHTNFVAPGDTSCTSALGHLDPTNATEALKCVPGFHEYCQEGDLSGKHGTLVGSDDGSIGKFAYSDHYVRAFPPDFSFLGRSIVIHAANKTRLACGNITSTLDGTATSNYQPTYKLSTFVKDYPTGPPFTPAVVNDPFVDGKAPTKASLLAMTFPLPNPLVPVTKKTLFVKLVKVVQEALFDNSKHKVKLTKVEVVKKDPLPFKGYLEKW